MSLANFIAQLKARVSLQQIVEADGVQLKRQGSRLLGLCPFHAEKTPSFNVYTRDDRFQCWGCGVSGDIVDYTKARHGIELPDAARRLAEVAGLEFPENRSSEQRGSDADFLAERELQRTLEFFVKASHEALLRNEKALGYLEGEGFTRETISELNLGYAAYSGAIDDKDRATSVGLLDAQGTPLIKGRLVFPIVFRGKVVNLSCRRFDSDKGAKYVCLTGRDIYPFNSNLLKCRGRVGLVEGAKDAALMTQNGIPTAGTIGTFFRDEWLKLCSSETEYVCLYDNDENQAGQKGNRAVAEKLFDAGYRSCVGELPPGNDPTDVIKEATLGAGYLQRAIAGAPDLLSWLVERLPKPANPYDLETRLQSILFPKLQRCPAIAHDHYLNKMVKAFGMRIPALRQAWETFTKTQASSPAGGGAASGDKAPEPQWEEEDPIPFNPAQWFGKGLGIYTIYAKSDGGLHPFIVSSDRKIRYLSPAIANELGLVFRGNKYPSEDLRWSVGTTYAFNVKEFLDGSRHADPAALFSGIEALLSRYIYWPDELRSAYSLLTLWTIGTYLHQLFTGYPYVHIRANPDSGKSTLLEILMAVCFNGNGSVATSESVVSRSANSDSPTMGIDEAENYRSKSQDETTAIFEVLKGGYKKGAIVRKAGSKKDNFRPETFDVYCPKVFASTQPIDPILSTRCIDIPLLKTDRQIPAFREKEIERALKELRGQMYFFGLEQWQNVEEAYLNASCEDGWINRSWEIWAPIMALAEYFTPYVKRDLVQEMVVFAGEIRKVKADREREQNFDQRLVEELMEFIRQHVKDHPEEFYPVSMLCDQLTTALTLTKPYSPESLSRFVFDQAHFAKSRTEDKKKLMHGMFSRQVPHIRLRKHLVWEKAVSLFGFDKSVLAELADSTVEPDPYEEHEGEQT